MQLLLTMYLELELSKTRLVTFTSFTNENRNI